MLKRFIKAMEVEPRTIAPGRLSRLLVSKGSVGVTAYSMGLHTSEAGLGPRPLETHEHESETIYVTQGTVKFRVGDEEFICQPDCFVHVPAGVPHGIDNIGEGQCKFIWIIEPPLPGQS